MLTRPRQTLNKGFLITALNPGFDAGRQDRGFVLRKTGRYDDRLEITSPGMLIGGFTIEDLKAGCCQARNRGIVNALTYMKIIEQWGSGIPRLLENCKSARLREPELLEIGGSFRVNMFRNTELASNNSGEVREKDGINEDFRDKFGYS